MHISSTAQTGPRQLLNRLIVAAMLSMVVILSAAGYGISKLYNGFVLDSARKEAINLGQAFVDSQQALLIDDIGLLINQPVASTQQQTYIDAQIKRFLAPYDILKIKVFSLQGQILYSTDHNIIGVDDSLNPRLIRALGGEPDSAVQRKDQMRDLSNEIKLNVDVVETYVPIHGPDGTIIGAFEIYQDTTDKYQQVRRGIYLSVGSLALILMAVYGIALSFIRLTVRQLVTAQQNLEHFATTDPLTQLYNRREILHRAEHELARFKRSEHPGSFSIMMIDLDHFKQVNDRYGHATGDMVLEQAAMLLRSALRAYCSIGRYGGEEFIALLPDTDHEQAKAISERLNKAIAQHPFIFEDTAIQVTASIGVVTAHTPDNRLCELISIADRNLYAAKAAGRNRFQATLSGPGLS